VFIKNFSSINNDRVILVNDIMKEYLQSLGYAPLSYNNQLWAFQKTNEILDIVSSQRKENNNE